MMSLAIRYCILNLGTTCLFPFQVQYYLKTASFSGMFYQLSQVFRDYGYSPIGGSKFLPNSYTKVTDTNDRIYYTSPSSVNPSSYEKVIETIVLNTSTYFLLAVGCRAILCSGSG